MSILFVLGLFTVVLVTLSEAHRYKGAEYKQTKIVEGHVDVVPASQEEADGYEECKDFLNDPSYNENYVEGDQNANAANGFHHLLNRHIPRPLADICESYECLDAQEVDSPGCGFATKILPSAYWMVADIDLSRELGVREAYKRIYRVRSGHSNDQALKMSFVLPVMKKYYLDENSQVVRAEIGMLIPAAYQSNPPASTYDEVRIEKWDEMKVYVRAYGGYRDDAEYEQQFDLLKLALAKQNIKPYPHMRAVVGYTYLRYGRQRLEAMLVDNDSIKA